MKNLTKTNNVANLPAPGVHGVPTGWTVETASA